MSNDAMNDLKKSIGATTPSSVIISGETILSLHGPRVGATAINPNETYCVDFQRRFIRTLREHFDAPVAD